MEINNAVKHQFSIGEENATQANNLQLLYEAESRKHTLLIRPLFFCIPRSQQAFVAALNLAAWQPVPTYSPVIKNWIHLSVVLFLIKRTKQSRCIYVVVDASSVWSPSLPDSSTQIASRFYRKTWLPLRGAGSHKRGSCLTEGLDLKKKKKRLKNKKGEAFNTCLDQRGAELEKSSSQRKLQSGGKHS